jgi:F-type H+-transporting ATPase subunit alpha
MNAPPDSLQSVFDNAFAGLSQGRETFTAQLTPREVGTITSVSTGIAKVSGLPGVGSDELVKFPGDWDASLNRLAGLSMVSGR